MFKVFIIKFNFLFLYNMNLESSSFQRIADIYFINSSIKPTYFIFFTTFMFCISFYGFITNMNHLLFSLINIELMILSISFNFIFFSIYLHNPKGQIIALLLLGVAASEAIVGLTLLIVSSKTKHTLNTYDYNLLSG